MNRFKRCYRILLGKKEVEKEILFSFPDFDIKKLGADELAKKFVEHLREIITLKDRIKELTDKVYELEQKQRDYNVRELMGDALG